MTTDYRGQQCAIYPRVSSDAQAQEQKNSLGEQEREARAYAATLGMTLDDVCVMQEVYTSTVTHRPVLNRLLATMRERGVRHLIVDAADRLTREGSAAAGYFLTVFREADITLHVALEDLIVNDDRSEREFMDLAFAAKKDNTQRTARSKRTKRGYARDQGRYMRGNRCPYGWRDEAVEWDDRGRPLNFRKVHDERTYGELGFGENSYAPTPFATREKMLRQAQQGLSSLAIADQLTRAGVPTSRMLAHEKHAPTTWSHQVVMLMLADPLNLGIATSFRTRYESMPPDAKHAHRWRRAIALPLEQHIALPEGTVQPIIGDAQAALIMQQRKANLHQRGTTRWAQQTLLGGGLVRCQKCVDAGRRGTLRVASARQRSGGHYIYYACRIHEQQPSLCSGLSVRADRLDRAVWAQVQAVLLEPGALERLAEEQATLDAGDDPTSHLAALKATHKDFAARIAAATDAVVNAPTAFVRGALMDKLAALEPALVELTAEIADYERTVHDHAARRQFLGNVRLQVQRYQALVANLDMAKPEHVPLAHGILRSLGFSVIVARAADHSIDLDIQFHVGGLAAVPWFGVPEEVDLVRVSEHEQTFSIGAPILLRTLPATEGSFAVT